MKKYLLINFMQLIHLDFRDVLDLKRRKRGKKDVFFEPTYQFKEGFSLPATRQIGLNLNLSF